MITRLSNAYDYELFEEQIKKLPVCVQEVILETVQTLNDSYGKYWESAFGSAEMYIVECETEDKSAVKEILEFYNIDPIADIKLKRLMEETRCADELLLIRSIAWC